MADTTTSSSATTTTSTTTTLPAQSAIVSAEAPHDGRAMGQLAPAGRQRAVSLARRPVYGLVIGINPSPREGLGQLRGAVNDANDMAAALSAMGAAPENIRVLRDAEATTSGILEAVDWLVATAGPEATVVFTYAGHVVKLGEWTEAMVAVDGGLITDSTLAAHFAGLGAQDAWFVFAACYGGGFTELLGPGRAVTAAADADNLAYESYALGRSYLAEYVIRQGLLQGMAEGRTVRDAVMFAQATLGEVRPDRQIVHMDQTSAPISLDGLIRLPAGG